MTTAIGASLTKDKVASLKNKDAEKYAPLPDEGTGIIEIQYELGDTPKEAGDIFGKDVVMSQLEFGIGHAIQAKIRNRSAELLSQGKSIPEAKEIIQAEIYNIETGEYVWKPGMAATRKSPLEKEKDRLSKLDPEKKEREIAALKAMLAEMESQTS